MNKTTFITVVIFFITGTIFAQSTAILDMRKRAEVIDNWLDIRFEQIIPHIMRRNNIEMWVLVARAYNEDPVMLTMLPATWQSSRRRTILVFFDREDEGLERIAVARYDIGRFFKSEWNPDEVPDQWERLTQIISERNPQKIAVNISSDFV
jgi:hypothetical protein